MIPDLTVHFSPKDVSHASSRRMMPFSCFIEPPLKNFQMADSRAMVDLGTAFGKVAGGQAMGRSVCPGD
jgi:hypothetical protein